MRTKRELTKTILRKQRCNVSKAKATIIYIRKKDFHLFFSLNQCTKFRMNRVQIAAVANGNLVADQLN